MPRSLLLSCICLMTACATPRIERASTVPTDPKAAARRFYATLETAIHTGNVSLLDDLLLPDVIDHNPDPNMKPGREGIKAAFAGLRAAFPDVRFQVEEVFSEGDKVACRVTTHATHRGPFLGFAATGRPIAYSVIDILRFTADGRLIERWGLVDEASLRQQLSAGPAPAH
ncbi:ester cyclase [Myxococcaceae bacterium JPH2]|nr:ester cyclase [Myxococcaceae bacterium JPH2]